MTADVQDVATQRASGKRLLADLGVGVEVLRAQAAFDRADRDAQDAQHRLADSTDRLDR